MTRGKGDLEKMSVCYRHLERRVLGVLHTGNEEVQANLSPYAKGKKISTNGLDIGSRLLLKLDSHSERERQRPLSSHSGLGTCRLKTALQSAGATQPGPQPSIPTALCTAVWPTCHLSRFLRIACSFIYHSSQAARDHVLFVQPPQDMAQGLSRGPFMSVKLRGTDGDLSVLGN